MNQLGWFGREDFGDSLLARGQTGIAELESRAGGLDGRDFCAGRIARHDDNGAHAARFRRERQRIAVRNQRRQVTAASGGRTRPRSFARWPSADASA